MTNIKNTSRPVIIITVIMLAIAAFAVAAIIKKGGTVPVKEQQKYDNTAEYPTDKKDVINISAEDLKNHALSLVFICPAWLILNRTTQSVITWIKNVHAPKREYT